MPSYCTLDSVAFFKGKNKLRHVTDYKIEIKLFELIIFLNGLNLQEGTKEQVLFLMRDISDIWIICESF